MYQKIRNLVFHTLIPAVLTALMLPTVACAQEYSCSKNIPVEIQTTGDRHSSDVTYKLKIEAITPNAPMPETAELTLVNGGTAEFGPMVYTSPEDYEYKIYQTSEAQDRFTYDKTVYIAMVRVTNDGNGGLMASIFAVNEASGEAKADGFKFTNSYDAPGGGGGGDGYNPPGDGLTVINDPGTPLGDMILDMIPDEIVPLGMLPKTGDSSVLMLWIVLAVLSSCGLVLLTIFRNREDY